MIDKAGEWQQDAPGLIEADQRIAQIRSGVPALAPDANASYFAEVVVDLDQIVEPMIADPDVNNADVSKRYTMTPSGRFPLWGDKKVDLGFVGSCMVHKGDEIVAQMLRNWKNHPARSNSTPRWR